jgi:hypothetical protein
MPNFKFVQLIRMGWVVGVATGLATICLYENTGNISQGRADNAMSSEGCITHEVAIDEGHGLTRIEAQVAEDDKQKACLISPIASIKLQSERIDDRLQSPPSNANHDLWIYGEYQSNNNLSHS